MTAPWQQLCVQPMKAGRTTDGGVTEPMIAVGEFWRERAKLIWGGEAMAVASRGTREPEPAHH